MPCSPLEMVRTSSTSPDGSGGSPSDVFVYLSRKIRVGVIYFAPYFEKKTVDSSRDMP